MGNVRHPDRFKLHSSYTFDRFMKYVKTNKNNCWVWVGSQNGRPPAYGSFRFNGKLWKSHRMAYNLFIGVIPTNKLVCHSCDNRLCVFPGHLWLGTVRDNNADTHLKGRNNQPFGISCHSAKLNPKKVIKIRILLKQGQLQKDIARK